MIQLSFFFFIKIIKWKIVCIVILYSLRQRRRQEEPKDPTRAREYRWRVRRERHRFRKNFGRRNRKGVRSSWSTGIGVLQTQIPSGLQRWYDARRSDFGLDTGPSNSNPGRDRKRWPEDAASIDQWRWASCCILL